MIRGSLDMQIADCRGDIKTVERELAKMKKRLAMLLKRKREREAKS